MNTGGLDQNSRRTLSALSNTNDGTIVNLWADPTTHRLLVDLPSSGGGITSINGDTTAAQLITVGTAGTDVAISNTVPGTTTINIPTASGTNRGVITSALYNTFNGKAEANQTFYIGTTQVAINRASASLSLAGVSIDGNAGTVTTAAETSDTSCSIAFVTDVSGSLPIKTNTNLTFNASTGVLTASNAIAGSITGNAATVTGLSFASNKTLTVNNILTLAGTDSTTMTFPSTSASIARIDAAQTFTGVQTFTQVLTTNNAITASGNAATVPVTSKINTVTNNSAATLTITMTTTNAVDGQLSIVRILDSSAAAQTITWVNTSNSTITAPTTSNGSTTLPLTVGFQYNGLTSLWRCIASV